jgi:glutathione peroxidase
LEILAFPCNQFGNQEPLNGQAIVDNFVMNYQVSFPILEKTSVNSHPLWEWLKSNKNPPEPVKWNFSKFLIDRKGDVRERGLPTTKPMEMEASIIKLIQEK